MVCEKVKAWSRWEGVLTGKVEIFPPVRGRETKSGASE